MSIKKNKKINVVLQKEKEGRRLKHHAPHASSSSPTILTRGSMVKITPRRTSIDFKFLIFIHCIIDFWVLIVFVNSGFSLFFVLHVIYFFYFLIPDICNHNSSSLIWCFFWRKIFNSRQTHSWGRIIRLTWWSSVALQRMVCRRWARI